MNNEDKNESNNNNNNYIIKSFYLIKNNFPTSDLFYRILFSLKYIGLIINSRIVEMSLNKKTISLNKYLCNFLIFGKSLSPIYSNYQLICFLGASFLLLFILFSSFSFIYMKIKYQNINSLIQEKMENNNEKIEEIFFKIIAYIEIVILFFHQYILEYYFFGFYGFIYYKMGIFSKNGTSSKIYLIL
jgi:flagellar biosynthesis protein FlhB